MTITKITTNRDGVKYHHEIEIEFKEWFSKLANFLYMATIGVGIIAMASRILKFPFAYPWNLFWFFAIITLIVLHMAIVTVLTVERVVVYLFNKKTLTINAVTVANNLDRFCNAMVDIKRVTTKIEPSTKGE